MNGRGMVELVIASLGFAADIIDLTLFSDAVSIGLATSTLVPITSRPFASSPKSKGSDAMIGTEPENE